jgi:hypothetical protein
VAQWYWLEDVHPGGDQFNSLHERLVGAWRDVAAWHRAARVHLASPTIPRTWPRSPTCVTPPSRRGSRPAAARRGDRWDAGARRFVDLDDRPITAAFKLYPWEWMAREAFAEHLAAAPVRWVEPAWKMVLSNKGILAVLWELFPDHPNLLPAYFDEWRLEAYARKPLLSREGANVRLVMFGEEVAASGGDYGEEGFVYQALAPLPRVDGRVPVLGSWVVAGEPAGMGVREADGLITRTRAGSSLIASGSECDGRARGPPLPSPSAASGRSRTRTMPPADQLRRKLTVRAHGRTLVLVKRAEESGEHVVQKAVLWARHLPAFPELRVEQRLPFPSRYKPDLYALDLTGLEVAFWGECGVTSREKMRELFRRHPATHFAFSRWGGDDAGFATLIEGALDGVRRRAPVELVGVPAEAAEWVRGARELVVPDDALVLRHWDP